MRLPDTFPIPDKREFWQTLDSTKLTCYARCPRKYFYEYVLGWSSSGISNHLIFGQAWHLALEHLYKNNLSMSAIPDAWELFMNCYRKELPESTDRMFKGKDPAIIPHSLVAYCQKYYNDCTNWTILATEIGGIVPISVTRNIALKMDMLVRKMSNNKIVAIEHKTGSKAGRTWTMQWETALQIGTYLHALNFAYGADAVLSEILINGVFFYAKERGFERCWQKRDGWAMLDWLDTVHRLYDSIENDFKLLSTCTDSDTNLIAFPKLTIGCTDYGGCPYFDLCTAVPNPLTHVGGNTPPYGYIERWWNPLEEIKNPLEQENGTN